ncbi:hypothetical protein [Streptomyces sp. NBC_00334]|uniref:hypothetical protein n=1 Tax=Streptomyces sp. NBC_00334 TaxID=2975713 RepID=UPI002E2B2308|nr:hypothetical protein [Streptomyces sp. NBC_00334]
MRHSALGSMAVRKVPELSAESRRDRAGAIAQSLYLDDVPGNARHRHLLRDGIRRAAEGLLEAKDPEVWDDLLAVGKMLVAEGRLVWLRPTVQAVAPAPPRPDNGVKDYPVSFGSTTIGRATSSTTTVGFEGAVLALVNAGAGAAATAFGGPSPRILMGSSKTMESSRSHTILSGRKAFINDFTGFDAGLGMRVFVDGEEVTSDHPGSGLRPLRVDLPTVFAEENGPRPAANAPQARQSAGRGRAGARSSQAREMLNAIDMTPAIAGLHRNLLKAGLTATAVQKFMTELRMDSHRGFLSEASARNRYNWWSGGDTSAAVQVSDTFSTRSFRAHVRLRAETASLQYVGDTRFGSRDDFGVGVSQISSYKSASTGGLGLGFNVLGVGESGPDDMGLAGADHADDKTTKTTGLVPALTALVSSRRDAGHSVEREYQSHTVLNLLGTQSRYSAGVRLTIAVESPTRRVEPVTALTVGELSVPRREAAAFVHETVGKEWSADLRSAGDGPEGPRHRVLTAPAAHRPVLRLPTHNPPWRRDLLRDWGRKLPTPHGSEPLALAARRGFGFGSPIGLSGLATLQDDIRAAVEGFHRTASGARKAAGADWSDVDATLTGLFSEAPLEADVLKTQLGVHAEVELAGRTYDISLWSVWGDLVEGPNPLIRPVDGANPHTGPVDEAGAAPLNDTYDMRINTRTVSSTSVTAERGRKLKGSFGLGGGLVVEPPHANTAEEWGEKVPAYSRIQLGAFRVRSSLSAGRNIKSKWSSKGYQRTETTGQSREFRYHMRYRWTVSPKGEELYRSDALRAVLRVAVSAEHLPEEPMTLARAEQFGNARITASAPPLVRPLDFGGGTQGVYTSFGMLPELARLTARLYAEANELPDSWLRSPEQWPESIRELADPTLLSAVFEEAVGRYGYETGLPGDGTYEQALRIKQYTHAPTTLARLDRAETEDYLQGAASLSRDKAVEWSLGVDTALGPDARLGGEASHEGPGGRVTAQFLAEAAHVWGTGGKRADGPISISRSTDSSGAHSVLTTVVFEVSHLKWRATKDPVVTTRYLSATDILNLLIPKRRIDAVVHPGSPTPRPVPSITVTAPPEETAPDVAADVVRDAAVTPERDYLNQAMISGISHTERLNVDGVLVEIVKRLRERELLPHEKGENTPPRPTALWRALRGTYEGPKLRARMPALLSHEGVPLRIPLPRHMGVAQYLWVKVTATGLGPARNTRPQDDVRLTLRAEQKREHATATSGGVEGRVGAHLRARGGHETHGGLEGSAEYVAARGTREEKAEKEVTIYRAAPSDPSEELGHDVSFRIEMAVTREWPEIAAGVVRTVKKAPGGIARLAATAARHVGTSRTTSRYFAFGAHESSLLWHDPGDGTRGNSRLVPGTVSLVVPRHLTTDAHRPSRPVDLVGPQETHVTWHSSPTTWTDRPSTAIRPRQEPPAALVEGLHPWSVGPAAAAVARWALLTGTRHITPPEPKVGNPPSPRGFHFTPDGQSYDHDTTHGRLRAHIKELLRHQYRVRLGTEELVVGLDLERADVLHQPDGPPNTPAIKQRGYTQADEEEKRETERSSGLRITLGPESGGESDEARTSGAAPVTLHDREHGRKSSAQSGSTDERNSERPKGTFRNYRFQVSAVVYGPYGTVRIRVPDGLTGMLPVDPETGTLEGGLERTLGSLLAINRPVPAVAPGNPEVVTAQAPEATPCSGQGSELPSAAMRSRHHHTPTGMQTQHPEMSDEDLRRAVDGLEHAPVAAVLEANGLTTPRKGRDSAASDRSGRPTGGRSTTIPAGTGAARSAPWEPTRRRRG